MTLLFSKSRGCFFLTIPTEIARFRLLLRRLEVLVAAGGPARVTLSVLSSFLLARDPLIQNQVLFVPQKFAILWLE